MPQFAGKCYEIIRTPGDLPERYGTTVEVAEIGLVDIDADTRNRPFPGTATLCAGTDNVFNKNTDCLSVLPIKVIRPFDAGIIACVEAVSSPA